MPSSVGRIVELISQSPSLQILPAPERVSQYHGQRVVYDITKMVVHDKEIKFADPNEGQVTLRIRCDSKSGGFNGMQCICNDISCYKECLPGTYRDPDNIYACFDCEAGKYQDEANQTSCKACPASQRSASGASSCTSCASGTFVTDSIECGNVRRDVLYQTVYVSIVPMALCRSFQILINVSSVLLTHPLGSTVQFNVGLGRSL